jgi:single-strand DNA-binding protein
MIVQTPFETSAIEVAMAFDNHVALVGSVVDDIELRYTRDSRAVTNFKLAVVSSRTGHDDGHRSYVDVACWGELAAHAAQRLAKGDKIVLLGRLERESWVAKDGQKRTKLKVVAAELGLALEALEAVTERDETAAEAPAGPVPDEEEDAPDVEEGAAVS